MAVLVGVARHDLSLREETRQANGVVAFGGADIEDRAIAADAAQAEPMRMQLAFVAAQQLGNEAALRHTMLECHAGERTGRHDAAGGLQRRPTQHLGPQLGEDAEQVVESRARLVAVLVKNAADEAEDPSRVPVAGPVNDCHA